MNELKEFVFWSNNVEDEELSLLIKALRTCENLEKIDLSDNLIKAESIRDIIFLVKENKNLKILKLSDCNISEDLSEELVDVVK